MNWKLRFKNKTVLVAFVGTVITFVYQILGIIGITPAITQDTITQLVGLLINVLVSVGVLVDPTTPGISDSNRALNYMEPGQVLHKDYQGPADLDDAKGE